MLPHIWRTESYSCSSSQRSRSLRTEKPWCIPFCNNSEAEDGCPVKAQQQLIGMAQREARHHFERFHVEIR